MECVCLRQGGEFNTWQSYMEAMQLHFGFFVLQWVKFVGCAGLSRLAAANF